MGVGPKHKLASKVLANCTRILRLYKIVKNSSKSTIVIGHGETQNLLVAIVSTLLRRKYCLTIHNNLCMDLNGIGRLLAFVTYRYLAQPSLYCFVSESAKRSFQDFIGAAPGNVVVAMNPCPAALLSPSRLWAGGKRKPLVVAVGRLSRQKNFGDLLMAFSRLSGNAKLQLNILGEGPERDSLFSEGRKLGLTPELIFLGRVANPEWYLQRSRCCVFTSLWEGLPIAMYEAMSTGTPVIAYNIDSGIRDIIQHDSSGIIVPVGDITALKAAIERLLSDDDYFERLSRNAQERVREFGADSTLGPLALALDAIAGN
jgi:glycosyltransferase involved in cell wall biosynthesis